MFTNLEITSSSSNQICLFSYLPYIGDMFIQDYPHNIYKAIWSNQTGVKKVNETIQFSIINEAKVSALYLKIFPNKYIV